MGNVQGISVDRRWSRGWCGGHRRSALENRHEVAARLAVIAAVDQLARAVRERLAAHNESPGTQAYQNVPMAELLVVEFVSVIA